MKNKIRFKRHPRETGLAVIGAGDPNIDIKINGKVCGYISHPRWDSKENNIRIRFMVYKENLMEDGNINSNWKWVTLKHIPENDEKAKEFLRYNIDTIVSNLNLRYEEE